MPWVRRGAWCSVWLLVCCSVWGADTSSSAGGTLQPIFNEQESLLDTLSLRLAMLRRQNETLRRDLDASHVDLRSLASRLSTLTKESETNKKKLLQSETDLTGLRTSLTDSERSLAKARRDLRGAAVKHLLIGAAVGAGAVLITWVVVSIANQGGN